MFFSSSHAAFAYTRLISNRGLQWRHGELTLVGKHVSLFLWLLLSTAVVIHYRRLLKAGTPEKLTWAFQGLPSCIEMTQSPYHI